MKALKYTIIFFLTLIISGCGNSQPTSNSTATEEPSQSNPIEKIEEAFEGSFDGVEQTTDSIELGKTVKLADCFKYDKSNIKSIEILDDGNFDNNAIGEYSITVKVTNNKDNTQENKYNISVVDTTPPELKNKESEIYLEKDSDFNIDDYFSTTDKSGTQKIVYDNFVNTAAEGTYTGTVFAEDESGNKSDSQEITVIVEDRSNCDIRNLKWGDSKETVMRYETASLYEVEGAEFQNNTDNSLVYQDNIDGMKTAIFYLFNSQNQLCRAMYVDMEFYSNYDYYLSDYDNLYEKLVNKYGEPTEISDQTGSMAKYCASKGQALQLGYLLKQSSWDLDDVSINIHAYCPNDIDLKVTITSKEYFEEPTDTSF